jgi:hypothetical protein
MRLQIIYYLHSNKTTTACFLLGDGIGDQVMYGSFD